MDSRIERHPSQVAILQALAVGCNSSSKVGQRIQNPAHSHTTRVTMATAERQTAHRTMVAHHIYGDAGKGCGKCIGRKDLSSKFESVHIALKLIGKAQGDKAVEGSAVRVEQQVRTGTIEDTHYRMLVASLKT